MAFFLFAGRRAAQVQQRKECLRRKISERLELEFAEVQGGRRDGENSLARAKAAKGNEAAKDSKGEAAGGAELWVSQQGWA
jgi:hypothetical protein